jgi:pimeloyl-ACP methyl ester carboxylesterase
MKRMKIITLNVAIGLVALVMILASNPAWSQRKATNSKRTVYVIVHGAWGGSWAFKKIDSLLTAAGHVVYRPSLTGQGERVHLATPSVNLSTHINDVVNTILFEDLRDIILVGHSYGGMVITGVADRVPDRIRRLVYLDAMVPKDGETVFAIMDPRGERIKPMIKGDYVVPPWVREDQKLPKDVPHPVNTFTEPISLKNAAAGKLQATYILTVDAGKKPAEDGFYASAQRAKERGWKYLEMTADHNPQWSAPELLASLFLNEL